MLPCCYASEMAYAYQLTPEGIQNGAISISQTFEKQTGTTHYRYRI